MIELMRRSVADLSAVRAPVSRTLSEPVATEPTLTPDLDRELAEIQCWVSDQSER